MQTNITKPKSICILRLSAIGDACHAVATVQAIQQRHPDAKITWVIGKIEAQLVAELKNIEFIIFNKKRGFKAYKRRLTTSSINRKSLSSSMSDCL